MQQVAQIPDAVANTLRTSKQRRDFLAHRYFRERAVDFTTPHGRDAMLAELERDQQLFEEADKVLTAFVEPLQKVRVTPQRKRQQKQPSQKETESSIVPIKIPNSLQRHTS
jgi:hypothetical protein